MCGRTAPCIRELLVCAEQDWVPPAPVPSDRIEQSATTMTDRESVMIRRRRVEGDVSWNRPPKRWTRLRHGASAAACGWPAFCDSRPRDGSDRWAWFAATYSRRQN